MGCDQTDQHMIKVKEYVEEDIHITTVSGFVRPFGVKFIQTGGILVADFGNNSVVRLSKTFEFDGMLGKRADGTNNVLSWKSRGQTLKGTKKGEFDGPHTIDVDPEGNIFVAETYNQRVQKLSSNGEFLGYIGNKIILVANLDWRQLI